MISPTIHTPNGQNARKTRRRTHVQAPDYHQTIVQAIEGKEVLSLEYQGNRRRIVPMVYGMLKNGRKAILCYKIVEQEGQAPELFMRLYHEEKIRHLYRTGEKMPLNRKIDYYLTKHFGQVFQKI